MISPDYLLHISEGAEAISESLHNDIIRRIVERIMIRLSRGDKYILTAQDKWQLETLQEAGYLLADIQKEIAAKTPYQMQEIRDAMQDAGVRALAYDNGIYRAAGLLDPLDGLTEQTAADLLLRKSPHYIRLMQRNYEATLGEWKNFTRTMPQAGYQLYVEQCDKAYILVNSGAVSYTQAYKDAINEACRKGVQVVYPSGHRDTIETATLRAIRTGTAQASEQISLVRQKEVGSALRLTSSHMGARPTHELWQGEVFWVDWDKLSALYPALMDVPNPTPAPPELRAKYREFCEATGIGTVTGLAGANCRHTSSVYIEGVSHNPFEKYDSKENKRIYDLTQKQRAMERSIRKQKRMVMGLKAAVDSAPTDDARAIEDAEYQKAAATLAEQNKAYNDFCKENDLRPLQDRLAIAQWDRKQAAAARGAAQRYKNSPK